MARKAAVGLRIVEAARAELGVKEVPLGSNRGPKVQVYQSSTWLGGTGWPWCVAFAWCWIVWGQVLKKPCPYPTAAVEQLESWARKNGWAAVGPPRIGDLACLNHGEHVTIVSALPADGMFAGLGGNQGHMVKTSMYRVSSITTLVRVPLVLHSSITGQQNKPPVYELVRGEGQKARVVFRDKSLDKVLGKAATLFARGVRGVKIRKRKK